MIQAHNILRMHLIAFVNKKLSRRANKKMSQF